MSYAEDSQVCLRRRPPRPDQGRLQAAKIPGRARKYETLLWLRACLSVRVRERVMKFTYATEPSSPRPAHFPTGLGKCLQIF